MNSFDITAAVLLDWVDLKWLMAADGRIVDLDRLQADPGYATRCVDLALASPQLTLRKLASRLRRRCAAAP